MYSLTGTLQGGYRGGAGTGKPTFTGPANLMQLMSAFALKADISQRGELRPLIQRMPQLCHAKIELNWLCRVQRW